MAFPISLSHLKPLAFALLLTLSILGFTKGSGCVERERLALLDFKRSFALFPGSYSILPSWNSSEEVGNCCSWEGITCDKITQNVISLDLSFQGLKSYGLRPSLLELQQLRSLDLSINHFATRIPNFIGSFSKLISLDISDAGFFGVIPPQLGNLSNIQALSLGFNNLSTDSFHWLSHLSSSESLDISTINFPQAMDWLSVIRKSPFLSSFRCSLCHIPTPELSSTPTHRVNSSSSLQTLDLSESYLSSSTLSLLMNSTTNLSKLHLSNLKLDLPLPDLFQQNMVSLETLDLSNNHLEVGIFNSIGNLCHLKVLQCTKCVLKESLVTILQALSGCSSSSLEYLSLMSSNLTGTIPDVLKFQSLAHLDLSDNWLGSFTPSNISSKSFTNGSLPNTFSLFPATLTNLYLENNNLSGVLSDVHFTNISQLQGLKLSNNTNLTVNFNKPPLSLVGSVSLSSCNLGPSFPRWLLALNNIVGLYISDCKISDTIPVMFWRSLSPFLSSLDLSSNGLYGTIPNIPFQFLASDLTIDLSSNALCGPIPFFLFKANELYLSKNKFSGFASIPHDYNFSAPLPSFFQTLDVVDLSENLLSGLIPHWLGFQKPNLGALNLANNNLSGTIPSSIGHNINLYVLSVRNNSLSGPLPSLLRNFSKLRILDLGGNRFTGFIPFWIGEDLKNLIVLSLGSNSLMHSLPISLCHLSSLQVLDLSHNLLSGSIPSCIHNLTTMAGDVNFSLDPIGNSYALVPLEQTSYFNAYIKWKTRVWKFQTTLLLVKLVDLSSNNLSGEIPKEVASLVGLESLDLSCNNLQASIPDQIGQLKSLQVLNLSFNRLSGHIPPSLSEISSLEMLDFSHNNLSGRIPKGTQLQSFDPSSFGGNPELCGLPLRKCPGDRDGSDQALQPSPTQGISEMGDKWSEEQCFLAGSGIGFAFGFLVILGTLTWIRAWRYAFFHFATWFGEWILLVVALSIPKISWKLRLK